MINKFKCLYAWRRPLNISICCLPMLEILSLMKNHIFFYFILFVFLYPLFLFLKSGPHCVAKNHQELTGRSYWPWILIVSLHCSHHRSLEKTFLNSYFISSNLFICLFIFGLLRGGLTMQLRLVLNLPSPHPKIKLLSACTICIHSRSLVNLDRAWPVNGRVIFPDTTDVVGHHSL